MKGFAMLTMGGVMGFVVLKLLTALFIPMLGLLFGLVAMAVKLALVAAVVFFVLMLLRRRKERPA